MTELKSMPEKERLQLIYKHLCNLEVKGENNVVILFNIMGFIKQEIAAIEIKEKTEKKEG